MKTNFKIMNCFLYMGAFLLTFITGTTQATITTWLGSVDNSWKNTANWSSGKPGATDTAVFDGTSAVSCTIDTAIKIGTIDVQSGYTGTITQGDFTDTIGTVSFAFGTGGAFVGDNDKSIVVTGTFTLSAGTFTSTGGTLEIQGNYTYSGGTFTHNSGTVKFNTNSLTITGSTTFNNLTFSGVGGNRTYTISTSPLTTLTVNGTLTKDGSFTSVAIDGGNIEAKGNISITNSGNYGGSALLIINGTGSQTFTAANSYPPRVEIRKTVDTLHFGSRIYVVEDWTYTSGIIDYGTSEVIFYAQKFPTTSVTITGTMQFYKLTFQGYAALNLSIVDTLTVNNTLTLSGGQYVNINSGVINAKGNITITNTGWGNTQSTTGNGKIIINGSGPQTLTGSGTEDLGKLPKVEINKTGDTLTLASVISTAKDWTYTAGNITAGSSTMVFMGTTNSATLTISGNQTFNNVTFYSLTANNIILTCILPTSLTVTGTLKLKGTAALTLNTGTIYPKGDIEITNTGTGGGGSATVYINGTVGQTITGISGTSKEGQGALPKVTINKTSGQGTLTFVNTISAANNWTKTALADGLTVTGSTLAFCGDLTVKGDMSLNNLTFYSPSGTKTITIGASGAAAALTTSGTVKATKGATVTIYNATGNGIN